MQMRFIVKYVCFCSLPLIHNQHLNNSAHYSWDTSQEKLSTKFNKVSRWLFELEILEFSLEDFC